MICEPLAFTGPGAQIVPLLILAVACLAVGVVILLMNRRRGRVGTTALLLLIIGTVLSMTAGTPTSASADVSIDCPPVNNSLTIIQTSVIAGLAPGIAPTAITGIVSNNSIDSTYITAVEVEITGVTTDPDSAPGICGPTDYALFNSRMPVDRALSPGGSTEFGGAFIGFNNKSTNQDACQGATVQLLYTANPN